MRGLRLILALIALPAAMAVGILAAIWIIGNWVATGKIVEIGKRQPAPFSPRTIWRPGRG